MKFQEFVFQEPYFGWLCRGVLFTLLITALTTLLSVALGVVVAAVRVAPGRWGNRLGRLYVGLFRNVPPVPFLLFLLFVAPGLWLSLTGCSFPRGQEFLLLVIGLSLNTSAYIAEILRSGIQSVPREHIDAGRVLGMKRRAVYLSIVLPEALRISLPALGTRLIHNMKNSTVALVLPLCVDHMEVLGQAARIAGQTFAWAEPLIFAACVHLTLALLLSFLVNQLARRAQRKIEVAR